jgi:4'-phosphopantetheinyl transferase
MPLPVDELHVWRATLDREPEVAARLRGVLTAEERGRAERFYLRHLGARYVVGRGLLRVLLGRYLGAPPNEIEFTYGEHGKPYLLGGGPWFNLSHSGAEVMVALSSGAEVGIDVEIADDRHARGRVAERFFSPQEVRTLRSLPVELQGRAFLSCWTRKEAFIKARGDGLSLPLDSFDVTLAPDEPPAVLRTAWSAGEPSEWCLVDLSADDGMVIAAAAARYQGWRAVVRRADDLVGDLGRFPAQWL